MEIESCSSVSTNEEELLLEDQEPLHDDSNKQKSNSEKQERMPYTINSHTVRAFEVLQSLRKDNVLCDIKLEAADGTVVYGHKVILASATPYFHTIFSNDKESIIKHITFQQMNSSVLKLLVDFIYTGQIMVNEDNVQYLLEAASLLQLKDVIEACYEFLQTHMNPINCLGFKALVSSYGCVKLLSSFESYIQQNFSEVIESDEFLSLPLEQVIELISSDTLCVPSEEKIFECVISWMNYNSDSKEEVLLKLMEHVRLPLTSTEYLLKRVKEEPLLKNSSECNKYIMEALEFHLLKYEQSLNIPNTIRTKPRQPVGLHEIILAVGYENNYHKDYLFVEWYDPVINKWNFCFKIRTPSSELGTPVLTDKFLLWFHNDHENAKKPYTLDLFSPSPCWKTTKSVLKFPPYGRICVSYNSIYIMTGNSGNCGIVFNVCTQDVKNISKMPIYFGVGVLNNYLYAVGGYNNFRYLKSVERYCPKSNTWTPVAEMRVPRGFTGVGTLNGILYAVGGKDTPYTVLKSVEAYNPSSNIWTSVADMHKPRSNPRVVALGGLLYVMGGDDEASIEMYNPKTNIWTVLPAKMNNIKCFRGEVVIDKPPCLNT